ALQTAALRAARGCRNHDRSVGTPRQAGLLLCAPSWCWPDVRVRKARSRTQQGSVVGIDRRAGCPTGIRAVHFEISRDRRQRQFAGLLQQDRRRLLVGTRTCCPREASIVAVSELEIAPAPALE